MGKKLLFLVVFMSLALIRLSYAFIEFTESTPNNHTNFDNLVINSNFEDSAGFIGEVLVKYFSDDSLEKNLEFNKKGTATIYLKLKEGILTNFAVLGLEGNKVADFGRYDTLSEPKFNSSFTLFETFES